MNTNKRVSTCGCYRNSNLLAQPNCFFTKYFYEFLISHLVHVTFWIQQYCNITNRKNHFVIHLYEIVVLVASLLLHPKIEGLSLGKLLAYVADSKTLINNEQNCFIFSFQRKDLFSVFLQIHLWTAGSYQK